MTWWQAAIAIAVLLFCGVKIGFAWARAKAEHERNEHRRKVEAEKRAANTADALTRKVDAVMREIDRQMGKASQFIQAEESARRQVFDRERQMNPLNRGLYSSNRLPSEPRTYAGNGPLSSQSREEILDSINVDPAEVHNSRPSGRGRILTSPDWNRDDIRLPPYTARYRLERARHAFLIYLKMMLAEQKRKGGGALKQCIEHEMGPLLVLAERMGEAIIESEEGEKKAGEQTVGEALAS